MLQLFWKYLLNYTFQSNYKEILLTRFKELLLAEAAQIIKLACYLFLAFPLLALSVYELTNFISLALYHQDNIDYLHLLNAVLLVVPVTMVTVRTIYYGKELKEKIMTLSKITPPTPGILAPIFNQLRKEQQTFLIEIKSQYQKE